MPDLREIGQVADRDGDSVKVGVLRDEVRLEVSPAQCVYLDAAGREELAHLLLTASHEADRNALAMRGEAGGG